MNGQDKNRYLFAYIAIGCITLGAVSLGLSFTVLGLYSLIASAAFQVIAMTFVNVQKRKYDFKKLQYIRIAAYAFFIVAIVIFASTFALEKPQS